MKSLFLRLVLSCLLACPFGCGLSNAADVTITATSVSPGANALFRYGIAGAAITAGQLCYLDTATNTWKLSDANASATLSDVDGLAINSAASGAPVTMVTHDDDLTLGGTVSKGTAYVLSSSAGGIAPIADLTTGWYANIVAVGKSSTKVVFRAEGLWSRVAQ